MLSDIRRHGAPLHELEYLSEDEDLERLRVTGDSYM